jgi:hypothetical protein
MLCRSRLQAVLDVALSPSVVYPASHAAQGGVATVVLPPALKVPLGQLAQLMPPVPAGQTVTVKGVFVKYGCCA